MTPAQRLQIEQSEKRQKINELLGVEELSDEQRSELDTLTKRMQNLEVELRAALVAEGEPETRDLPADSEQRERIELRSRASLTNFLLAAARGRMADGAEAELQAAAGVQGIPLELWDVPETRAATEAPSTVGVNLDPIRPAVFAASVAPRLGIEMPRVSSGTYATATVTTSMTAAAKAKGVQIFQSVNPANLPFSRCCVVVGFGIRTPAARVRGRFAATLHRSGLTSTRHGM